METLQDVTEVLSFFKDGKGLACFWATGKLPVERERNTEEGIKQSRKFEKSWGDGIET